jgi:hypothetical protein
VSEIPIGKVLASGHVYKVHFQGERALDSDMSQALSSLGVVKVEHVTAGGENVAVTPNNTKENA